MSISIATLLVSSALLLSATAGAQVVRDARRPNTNGQNLSGDNAIDGAVAAVRGATFYAAWAEQFGTNQFTQDIYLARSTDDGETWNFTTWFRDSVGGTATSNFTNGLRVDFL